MKKFWFIRLLVILDIGWSATAWVYDKPVLASSPPYLWLMMIVCPLYPLLLAYVWHKLAHRQKPIEIIYIFAIIGGCVYGALAPIYYTEVMILEGFNWLLFGAIFWVWFYSIQSFYLLLKHETHVKKFSIAAVFIYLTLKLLLDYRYETYGYMSFSNFSQTQIDVLFIAALFALILANIILSRKNSSSYLTK